MADYWLGVATVPALAATGVAGYVAVRTVTGWVQLVTDPTRDYGRAYSAGCPECGLHGPYVMRPPFTPEWVVRRISLRLHQRGGHDG